MDRAERRRVSEVYGGSKRIQVSIHPPFHLPSFPTYFLPCSHPLQFINSVLPIAAFTFFIHTFLISISIHSSYSNIIQSIAHLHSIHHPSSLNPSTIFTQSIIHPHSIHQPSSLNPSSILTQSIIHLYFYWPPSILTPPFTFIHPSTQ